MIIKFDDLKKNLDKEEIGEFVHNWIKEFGMEFTKDNNIFLKLETVKQFFANNYDINLNIVEKYLNFCNSQFYNKYNILGFYRGKIIYRSYVATQFTQLFKKIINKININSYKEGQLILDYIEIYYNKYLEKTIKFI